MTRAGMTRQLGQARMDLLLEMSALLRGEESIRLADLLLAKTA